MHEITYYIATIWLTGLLCTCVGIVIRTRSAMVRILAFDALTLVLVALLIMYSVTTETSYYLDAALMLALLSFISTVVASRYYSERKVFSREATMRAYVFDVFVILGVMVMTLGVIGLIRMPDVYTKLHGASKSVFLGVTVLAFSGLAVGGTALNSRLTLVCLALLVTTPVASHIVGRAAFLQHETMETEGAIDESGSLLPVDDQPGWRV